MTPATRESGGRLHFIKKIPPSGAAPSYKLTLPHQIVNQHLQHFVKADFELASSATTSQTWHGFISPRRNKERAEFILQGWKLFAEAHKIQAGDHVLFELSSPWRLVARLVHVPPSDVSYAHPAPQVDPNLSPRKSQRAEASSNSPRHALQSQAQMRDSDTMGFSQAVASAPIWPTIPSQASPAHARLSKRTILQASPESSKMAERVQSWLSLNSLTESGAAPSETFLTAEGALSHPCQTQVQTPRLRDEARAVTSSPQALMDLPGIFDDDDLEVDFHQWDTMLPEMPLIQATESRAVQPQPTSNRSPPVSASLLYTTAKPEVAVPPPEEKSTPLLHGYHQRLDKSSRSALKATVGLESNLIALCRSEDPGKRQEAQNVMASFLRELKESLWQTLVLANDMGSL